MSNKRPLPWAHLEEYRGKDFAGEWPTFPELLAIQVKRFADRPCFTDFDGPDGSKRTLNYSQVYEKVQKLANFLNFVSNNPGVSMTSIDG